MWLTARLRACTWRTALISFQWPACRFCRPSPAIQGFHDIPELCKLSSTCSSSKSSSNQRSHLQKSLNFSRQPWWSLLKAEITHQEALDAIQLVSLDRYELFDIFWWQAGRYSNLFIFDLPNPEASLTDEEVAKYMENYTWSKTRRRGALKLKKVICIDVLIVGSFIKDLIVIPVILKI